MKKIALTIFLITLLCTTFIFSCSDKNNNNNTNETPNNNDNTADNSPAVADENQPDEPKKEARVFADDDLGEWDFGGYTFRLLSRESGYLNVEEQTGDVLNDSMYYRNRKIEERFNITITEQLLSGWDMAPARKSLKANDNAYDMMVIRCPDAYVYAQEGLIHSINALPHVNLDKPYWDKWLTSQWSIANKSYFASGAFDLPAYTCTFAMLFNKQIAAELALEDLYKLVLDGKWTFDKFEELGKLAKKDLNGDGVFDTNDRHGYLAVRREISPGFWISGGVKSIKKDANDIPYLTANEEQFVNVFNKLVAVTLKSGVWYQAEKPDELNDPLLLEMFKNNKGLFYDTPVGEIPNLRDMEIDFGILPYPKYNEAQTQYYTRLGWAELICIPLYSDEKDLERTSVILESLACESAKGVIPVYYDIALKTKHARDEESEAMIDIIFDARVFDFGDNIWTEFIRNMTSDIFEKKSDTLISELEKVAPKLQKAIDKTVEAFLKLDQ